MKSSAQSRNREVGAVLVLFAVAMVVLIGVVGLALDMGHLYFNKTKLQNALDAGALSGAKILSDGATTVVAEALARSTFSHNINATDEIGLANSNLDVQFSQTLIPFTPGAVDPNAKYIRLRVTTGVTIAVWLAQVLPNVGKTLAVGGSAVAGPSPPLDTPPGNNPCDVVPVIACGTVGAPCTDTSCYGFPINAQTQWTLKTCAPNSLTPCNSTPNGSLGSGNFQLIQLGCGAGANCVRQELAGGYQCLQTDNNGAVTTKPGNTVGPVDQGLNTRFGQYSGPVTSSQYPPDAVTYYSDPSLPNSFWYSDYQARLKNGQYDFTPVDQGGTGVPMRRVVAVPIGDCTNSPNGQGTVPVIGMGCFFLTQPATHQGNTQAIYGQFVGKCGAAGQVSQTPGSGPLYKIWLYKDPDSLDS